MAIHLIQRGVTTELATEFLSGRPTSCTLTVKYVNDDGDLKTLVNAAAATIDTVNTTLDGAVAADARSLVLADVAGVVVGRRYMIGAPGGTEPHETVSVKSVAVATKTVTLWGPLFFAHSTAATFKGLRVAASVAGSLTTNAEETLGYWKNGSVAWTPDVGDPLFEIAHCVKFRIPEVIFDLSDVLRVLPKAANLLDVELDIVSAFRATRDRVVKELGPDRLVHGVVSSELRDVAAIRFLIDQQPAFGKDWDVDVKNWEKRYARDLESVNVHMPADVDKDAKLNESDGGDFIPAVAV